MHIYIDVFVNTKSHISRVTLTDPWDNQVEPIVIEEIKPLSQFYLLMLWPEVQEKKIDVPMLKFLQSWLTNESF